MNGRIGSWLPVVALALAAALAGLLVGRWYVDGGATPAPPGVSLAQVGEPRPELVLPDLDGRPQSLAQFDGRPLLINYWATWCPPCVDELPRLADLHARRDRDGIAVLAIAMEHEPAAVRDFLAERGLELTVWMEPPGNSDSSVRLGNTRGVLPYSVLIDADGRIVARKVGVLRERDLADWVRQVAR